MLFILAQRSWMYNRHAWVKARLDKHSANPSLCSTTCKTLESIWSYNVQRERDSGLTRCSRVSYHSLCSSSCSASSCKLRSGNILCASSENTQIHTQINRFKCFHSSVIVEPLMPSKHATLVKDVIYRHVQEIGELEVCQLLYDDVACLSFCVFSSPQKKNWGLNWSVFV